MVYNDETKMFQQTSLEEAIEALRRRTKKKILHRKIQDRPEFILVEDVYYQVRPYQDASSSLGTPLIKKEPLEPIDTPLPESEAEDDWDDKPTYPPPKFLPTAPQPDLFRVPAVPKPTFAQELLDSTTNFFLPPKTHPYEDRPLRGTGGKSYSELLDEILVPETKPVIPIPDPPTNIPEATPEQPVDPPKDDDQLARRTRSHHPDLHPGLP
jgi:hypothetical protein